MFDKYKNYDNIRVSFSAKFFLTAAVLSMVFACALQVPCAFAKDYGWLKVKLEAIDEYNKGEAAEKRPKKESAIDKVAGQLGLKKKKSDAIHVLKKADITRIGVASFYEDFTGIRFGKYFTVAQRVEIFQEARPIDAYILDAKAIRYLGQGGEVREWNTPAHFRSQIVPLFTRAYGTQITMDNPDDPGIQLRYTLDNRDLYRQYYPKWPNLGASDWMQNEIMLICAKKIPGIDWNYTLNLGYRYSTINETDISETPTKAGYENRHTYMLNMAIAPTERLEWFNQLEYFKSKRPKSTFPYSPDHYLYRTELRLKTPDLKTSIIPSFSYSIDYYYPFKNTFKKYETGLRVGHEFTKKLSATTQLKYVLSLRDESDNTAPDYGGAPHPIDDMAAWAGIENRVSYNFWDKFYVQGGLDIAVGTNMSDFDNWGTFLGIEYYKPGILRANFGWNTNTYYNIDDFLSTIGFRAYIFM